ncbi:hypothetical protein [Spiroplasma endosymbiont of Tiphia femorata]|uniref:hypothetical protein n=1 Tax=Spiroplasma endosymbiont of Tiphia femorata TaxID=3066326 RepID=UPI0030CBCD86
MINKLWTDVSLENYNNWYPLTGKITETPQQYIQTWPNVNDWFKTFAIRAQNDINAYLDFILSKFPFDSFKDELIKETLRDMVYVMVEHWVFNRTPIEFNVDATIQFNNGSQFSASSTPTINVWDLAPSRMKIWARLTELKQIFSSYNDDEIDIEKIDLKAFYTRNQVDELIEQQKEFTLSKQIKLYDDLVDDNENEIYRGPVSKFVNKGYVATDYDKETETMILDWPDEIGTLPPEALQNNPQIGDYTHAPTCDFSAKQQKRITTNENNITKLNDELTKTNESIDDIKNNWFNIETSPLWKKINNDDFYLDKWTIILWVIDLQDKNDKKIVNTLKKEIKFLLNNNESYNTKSIIQIISWEEMTTVADATRSVTLFYDYSTKKILFEVSPTPPTIEFNTNVINQIEVYQYQGTGIPTEFITEEGTERDYYTKLETNNLLDKKQNKLIAGTNITIDENNKISASGGSSVAENRIFNNKDDKENTTRLVNEVIKTNVGGKTLIYRNNPVITDDLDIPNKKYIDDKIPNLDNYYIKTEVDKKLEDTEKKFPVAFQINAVSQKIPNLETTNKTIGGAINELKEKIPNLSDYYNKTEIDKKLADFKIIKWKVIGNRIDDKTWKITYAPLYQYIYRIFVTWEVANEKPLDQGYQQVIFFKSPRVTGTGNWRIASGKIGNSDATLNINFDNTNWTLTLNGGNGGAIINFEVLEQADDNVYQINSKTLNIISPEKIDIEKPIKINSYSLETNEIRENEWDIELKNNPTPNIPQWKEVGTREKNKWDNWQITYDFQENKHYRVYYSWSIYNPVYTIQEFIITDKKIAGVQIQTFNDSANIVILSVQHAKWITIYTGKGNLKGNVWKLEELQE